MADRNLGERISGYCIRDINGYEVHAWAIGGPAIYGVYGLWPHHNPKVGSHYTVEPCSSEDVCLMAKGEFDRETFSRRIIRQHRQNWPKLWEDQKE